MNELSPALSDQRSEPLLHGWPRGRDVSGGSAGAMRFGPFRLVPRERLLLQSGKPVSLGSRALDILIALVERAGELVGKHELINRVWPSVTVVEDNLTVHMAALRRALADGRSGNRYIATVPGRGYCFVARVTHEPCEIDAEEPMIMHDLRRFVRPLIGRQDSIVELAATIPGRRIVTITGPGGVGKSSVAAAVGEGLRAVFSDGVFVVDLSAIGDPRFLTPTVARGRLFTSRREQARAQVTSALEGEAKLLILDNCEQISDQAAALIEGLLRAAPDLHVLATSRVPLSVDGERVYRLSGLDTPPDREFISAADAWRFPSVQLFVEHAAERWGNFRLDDLDAPDVAQICKRLEGIPLAIKLAAAHVGTLGVRGLRDCLGDRFPLLSAGEHGSPLRQRSMRHSIAWTYRLLSDVEKSVLERLSTFDGCFTVRGVCAVGNDSGLSDCELIDAILTLSEKSLLLLDAGTPEPRLRLSEMTRAFIRHRSDGRAAGFAGDGARGSSRPMTRHA